MKNTLILASLLFVGFNLKAANYKQNFESVTLNRLTIDSGWSSSGVIDFTGGILGGNKAIVTPVLSNPLAQINLRTPLFKGSNVNTFSFDHRIQPSNSSNVRLFIEILDSANNLIRKDSVIYSGSSSQSKSITFNYNGSYKINYRWTGNGGATVAYIDNIATNTAFAPLPVKLLNFNAISIKNITSVKWQSASEEEFSNYEVYRSVDGKTFQAIAKVNPNHNAGEINNYEYTDYNVNTLGANKVYYRLKMNDINGSFTWSNTATVNVNTTVSASVNVFPNPAADVVNIDCASLTGSEFTITITDINGKFIQQINSTDIFSNIVSVDLNSYESGLYVISAITAEGNASTIKFLKK